MSTIHIVIIALLLICIGLVIGLYVKKQKCANSDSEKYSMGTSSMLDSPGLTIVGKTEFGLQLQDDEGNPIQFDCIPRGQLAGAKKLIWAGEAPEYPPAQNVLHVATQCNTPQKFTFNFADLYGKGPYVMYPPNGGKVSNLYESYWRQWMDNGHTAAGPLLYIV